MESNKEEALKCLLVAKRAEEAGDLEKAVRFIAKSIKLFPMPEAHTYLANLKSNRREDDTETSNTASEAESADYQHHAGPRPYTRNAHRRPQNDEGPSASTATASGPKATPEQIELVKRVKLASSYYEIFGLAKGSCDENDIKKAYKKLALKLHPDKNRAAGADEAFKLVSKAYTVLTDDEKRAAYDRYGHEDGPQQAARRNHTHHQNSNVWEEELDPYDVFNMFFNGGFVPPQARRRANMQQQARARQAHTAQANVTISDLGRLLQLLPLLLLFVFTFFSGNQEPAYQLEKSRSYAFEVISEAGIPYFVQSQSDFEAKYPKNTMTRKRLEQHVHTDHREVLERKCYYERIEQQKYYRWGDKQRARDYPMPGCVELKEKYGFGTRSRYL